VEALDAQGKWVRVVEDMGFPAGLERTMVCRLDRQASCRHAAHSHHQQSKIYWDAIRIDQTPDAPDVRLAQVLLARAALDFVGLSARDAAEASERHDLFVFAPEHDRPYARAAGNYTRYGDVFDLLRDSDDRFVVFGSGEGLKLDFDPRQLPALPAGWIRDYSFTPTVLKRTSISTRRTRLPSNRCRGIHCCLIRIPRKRLSLRCRTPRLSTGVQHARAFGAHASKLALSVSSPH